MSAPPCEFLAWDSEFFGFRIARVTRHDLDDASCTAVEAWCARNAVDCLYYLAAAGGGDAWLTARGFAAVDVRLTLEAPLAGRPAGGAPRLRRATGTDIPALRGIAAESHQASRFFNDPRLAPRAPALYATWIEKSVHGMAAAVFVPDADTVSGYITCDERQDVGQIGLLGVAATARGQGHGRRLIEGALDWFGQKGCRVARVVTQGGNARAVSVYEACGFTPILSEQWYHRWFRTSNQ